MPAWIHDRAEHLLAKNPSMKKSTAFAVATQQSHRLGKSPKGYGTATGKRVAKAKLDKPKKEYVKGANPGDLESPKMAASDPEGHLGQLDDVDSVDGEARLKAMKVKQKSVAEVPERTLKEAEFIEFAAKHAFIVPTAFVDEVMKVAKYLTDQIDKPKLKPVNAEPPNKAFQVKKAFAKSQYSGALGPGRLPSWNFAPAFTMPQVKTGGPPSEDKKKYKEKTAKKSEEVKRRGKQRMLGARIGAGLGMAAGLTAMGFSMRNLLRGAAQGLPHAIERLALYPTATMPLGGMLVGALGGEAIAKKFQGAPPHMRKGYKSKKKEAADIRMMVGRRAVKKLMKVKGEQKKEAATPAGVLAAAQKVGKPKTTPAPGPSIAQISKPVGFGRPAPGATKVAALKEFIRLLAKDIPGTPRLFMRHRTPAQRVALGEAAEKLMQRVTDPAMAVAEKGLKRIPAGRVQRFARKNVEMIVRDPLGHGLAAMVPFPILPHAGVEVLKKGIRKGINVIDPV